MCLFLHDVAHILIFDHHLLLLNIAADKRYKCIGEQDRVTVRVKSSRGLRG